jgi:SNF2 family DNA or RNA helicase
MTELWKHQVDALDFIRDLDAALLDCGMGTGKSRMVVEATKMWDTKWTLIVCPLSVAPAWLKQFALFGSGDEDVLVLNKYSTARKAEQLSNHVERCKLSGRHAVVVINYDAIWRPALERLLLYKLTPDLVVFDEIHRIKSPSGKSSRFCARLAARSKRRLGLTGTPMPHSPLDVYAEFRSLDPSVFGTSFVRFRAQYGIMGGFGGKQVVRFQNLDDLRRRMATLTYQASRDLLDLPPALHHDMSCELSTKARRAYEEMDSELRCDVGDGEITAANAMVRLLRLQQITSGFVRIGDDDEMTQVDDSKQRALEDLLLDLPVDEPVVVFGRFKSDLQAAHTAAAKIKRKSLELSGSRRELERWQDGEAPILAVQIQSGGTGIDLTRAAYCVYMSTGYSLGDYEQSLARTHRPGQERTVHYYHMIAKDTYDENVARGLKARKNLVESVLHDIAGALETPVA